MNKQKGLMIVVLLAVAAAFYFGASWYRNKEVEQTDIATSQNAERLVRPYSPSKGPEAAKVTVVEFYDPECEACARFSTSVKQIMSEFDGKVRFVARYMPFHKNSVYAASVLEAARKQGKYWEAMELAFEKQPEWASHEAPRPELLVPIMLTLGLNGEQLKSSMEDAEIKSRIQQDQMDGAALGVRATPTFFVNGKVLPKLGYPELRAAIQAALN
jgi:protein-disulfide isomerase